MKPSASRSHMVVKLFGMDCNEILDRLRIRTDPMQRVDMGAKKEREDEDC